MKCSFCDNDAVYWDGASGKYYCAEHFSNYFEDKVLETIIKYNLIKRGERIGVAVSGGKDSTVCFLVLGKLSKELDFEVVGILIDEGIGGYREHTITFVREVAKKYGLNLRIYSFKEEFGYTLDEMVKIAEEKASWMKPCTICGVLRRWLLNKAAIELNLDKLATAHTINDEVQTFFMDLIKNNQRDLERLGPITGVSKIEGFIQRIKPFYFIWEKETMTYILSLGLFPPLHECPYAPLGDRWKVRFALYDLEEKYPGTHEKVANFIIKFTEKFKGEKVSLGKCEICGFPTNRKICKACEIRRRLGIL